MPTSRNISKTSCNVNVSRLSSDLVFRKESSRVHRPGSRAPACIGRSPLTVEEFCQQAGLHVCESTSVWPTSFSCPSDLSVYLSLNVKDNTFDKKKLEPFGGLLLTLQYLTLFPYPPASLTLVMKGDEEHLFYNVKIAEIANHFTQQTLRVND